MTQAELDEIAEYFAAWAEEPGRTDDRRYQLFRKVPLAVALARRGLASQCEDDAIGAIHHVEAFLKDIPGNSVVEKAMNAKDIIASQWRPIETAPKDGTQVILWIVNEANLACFEDGFWCGEDGQPVYGTPTYYMLLPPAPDVTREEREDLPGEANALSEAAMALAACGIEIKLPWNCDLDDLEQSQYEGLENACRSYAGTLYTDAVAWREVSSKLYDLWAALCASDDATVRKMAARVFDGGRTPPSAMRQEYPGPTPYPEGKPYPTKCPHCNEDYERGHHRTKEAEDNCSGNRPSTTEHDPSCDIHANPYLPPPCSCALPPAPDVTREYRFPQPPDYRLHVVDNTGDCVPECWCKSPATREEREDGNLASALHGSNRDPHMDIRFQERVASLPSEAGKQMLYIEDVTKFTDALAKDLGGKSKAFFSRAELEHAVVMGLIAIGGGRTPSPSEPAGERAELRKRGIYDAPPSPQPGDYVAMQAARAMTADENRWIKDVAPAFRTQPRDYGDANSLANRMKDYCVCADREELSDEPCHPCQAAAAIKALQAERDDWKGGFESMEQRCIKHEATIARLREAIERELNDGLAMSVIGDRLRAALKEGEG